eukprot:jgi/Tetstr1/459105/TSEL_004555.t1
MGVVHVLANLTSRSPLLMAELRKMWFILDSNDISICLIDNLVIKLHTSGTAATVTVPYWPDRGWHQRLSEMASEVAVFPPSPDLFAPCRLGVRTGVGPPKWPGVAFWLPCWARCPAPDF